MEKRTRKKYEKMREGMRRQPIQHLPEDLIAEILCNSGVKSLVRFKSVSKSWHSLICSPRFVKDHLNKSETDSNFTRHKLIGTFDDKKTGPGPGLRWCSLKSFLDEPNPNDVVSTWDHRYPTAADRVLPAVGIVGSCNGLILVSINTCSSVLLNPCTGKLKGIHPPSSSSPRQGWNYLVRGFGYDDLTRDYKVVWSISYHTEIYSVRTNSWKKIDNLGMSFSPSCPGVFVSGKLHWLRVEETEIVSLALVEGEESYQVMALPEYFSNCGGGKLENLGGYLSLVGSSGNVYGMIVYRDINVWVMMKYGVAESWTKIWTLSDFDHPRRLLCYRAKPFWVTENGDIFVVFGTSEVVVYNAKSKLRMYRISKDELEEYRQNSDPLGDYKPIVYVESLVSP